MKKLHICIFVITFFIAPQLSAQDGSILQEHLRLLPDLGYTSIDHSNLEEVRNSTEYPMVRWIEKQTAKMNRSILMMPRIFPSSLHEGITAITSVNFSLPGEKLIYFKEQPEPDQMHNALMALREKGVGVYGNASKIEDPQGKGRFVYSVPLKETDFVSLVSTTDVKSLLDRTLKSGYFKNSGEKLHNKRVFTFEMNHLTGKKTFKSVKLNEQTLLIFSKDKSLEIFLSLANGETLSIVENENYQQLLDVLHSAPPLFHVQIIPRATIEKSLARIDANKRTSEIEKKQQRDRLLSFSPFLVNGIQVNKELMVKSVMIFDQEQYAKLNEERIKLRFSSMNPGTNEVEGFNKFKTKLSVTRKEKLVFVNMPIDMELAKLQIRISKEHLKQIEAEKARRKRDLEAGNGKEK